MTTIPENFRDLFDGPVVVSLATVLEDGQPQVHPVWADFDGTHVRVNTGAGRAKHRNMEEHPQVTVLAVDPDDPFRWIEVRGKVTRTSQDGADAHIDSLTKVYIGADTYPGHTADEDRIICYVEPTRIVSS